MGLKEVIKEQRGQRSWQEFAKHLGVSRMTLYNAINGVGKPSYKLLKALKLVKV